MSFRITFTIVQTPFVMIYLSVLLFISFAGCREQVDPIVKAEKQPLAINAIALKKVNETVKTATYFGVLEPNRTRLVAFTAPGKLKFIAPRGQAVGSNESLAELDVDVLEEQKQSLQSQLAQVPNQRELQQRIAGLDEQIQARRIVAPFDCVVDETFAYENSLIRAQSPVLRILDSKNPKVNINLPSRVARFVDTDLEVNFVLDDVAVVGNLAEKSKMENAGSVSFWFDIKSDLSNIEYRFGQTVEVRFNYQIDNSGFWVPLSALERSGEGIWSLLVVETNNGKSIVVRKLVTIVQITDDEALVDGNKLDGALAISNGIHRVVPGQEVEPQIIQNGGTSIDEEASE